MKHKKFYTKKSFIALMGIVVIALCLFFFYSKRQIKTEYETSMAIREDLIQEVSVTGRIKPVKSANLAFEVSGKTIAIKAKVGDRVKAGQDLVLLDSSDEAAQLNQAQAGLASAQSRLDQYQAALQQEAVLLEEMLKGARPEEIAVAETAWLNAEKALEEAEANLTSIQERAEADLNNVYSGTLNALSTAVNYGKSALIALSDLQSAYFTDQTQEDIGVASAKEKAVYSLLGYQNGGRMVTNQISKLAGGAYGAAQNALIQNTPETTGQTLVDLITALNDVKFALNAVVLKPSFTSTDKATLDLQKNNIDAQLSALSAKQQLISLQKVTNDNAIRSARSEITYAKNSLELAKSQLNLKKAGYTADQIKAQEARVAQAKANLSSQKAMVNQAYATIQQYQAQLAKTILKAPFDGIITRMDARAGEIVYPGASATNLSTPLISIMSDENFEIEADVPEVDIAKVKSGDEAKVTLDAYGSDVIFDARVVTVDPAESVIDGVPTYNVTLQFNQQDERIKSGMTANVDIVTDKKEGVVTIPQRAVISKEGVKTVRLLKTSMNGDRVIETLEEIQVEVGIRGSNGKIEIKEGLKEGDQVVVFVKN